MSSILQPKTRRLDEAYHRLQLLHLSQNLEDKRLLKNIKKNARKDEKNKKNIISHNKNGPFELRLMHIQNSNRTPKLGNSAAFLSKQLKASGWVVPRRKRVSSAWAWTVQTTTEVSPLDILTECNLLQQRSSWVLYTLIHVLQNHAYHTSYTWFTRLSSPMTHYMAHFVIALVPDLSQFWPRLNPILPKGSLFGAGAICSPPSAHRSWSRQARGTYHYISKANHTEQPKVRGILCHKLNPFKFQSCRIHVYVIDIYYM